MGNGLYTLKDGRQAGYYYEAPCDYPGCSEMINRGLSFLCGHYAYGHEPFPRAEELAGCANYYCSRHIDSHSCTLPSCGSLGDEYCDLARGHTGLHRDHVEHRDFPDPEKI